MPDVPSGCAGALADRGRLLARLARIEGQVRGVAHMIEEERACIDVLTQISAIQAALDKVSLGVIDGQARTWIADQPDPTAMAAHVDELIGAVGRVVGR